MRFLRISLLSLFLMMPSMASAQSIDYIHSIGHYFDIPTENMMVFHVPQLEVKSKGFTFNIAMYFDASTADLSEQDLTFRYDRVMKEWSPKLTLSSTLQHLTYFMDFTNPRKQRSDDWRFLVEGRWSIKR